jgi:magnesium-transporting ATPase (P-type)
VEPTGIAGGRPWHALTPEEAMASLASDAQGLSGEEAARRLAALGPNELAAEQLPPWWRLVLHQLQDPLIYVLLVAAGVTLALRDFADTGVILAVVALNALIGFVQERRAHEEMRALSGLAAPRAEVLREGRQRSLPSRELVPGDIVLLAAGNRVPADLRLFAARELEVDESALTGESLPARKRAETLAAELAVPGDQLGMAFSGTVVTRGRGRGVVVHTGSATEVGRIATVVRELRATATPLQQSMERFGRRVGLVVLGLALVVAALGLWRGMAPGEVFLAAVAIAVAAIPEGLPVVLTITLAIGVRRMARRRAIVRRLPAVETLGSTTTIGSDKTGTLTHNQMTVRTVWAAGRARAVDGVGYGVTAGVQPPAATPQAFAEEPAAAAIDAPLAQLLLTGVLANEAPVTSHSAEGDQPAGDPTEQALLVAARNGGVDPADARGRHREIDLLPFEPERRLMASLNESPDGERMLHVKGAPEAVLTLCSRQLTEAGFAPLDRRRATEAADAMGREGLRVLAMAFLPTAARTISEPVPDGLVLAGFQGMEDPVRLEAIDAVAAAQRAGIRVLMITGDHAGTARVVGARLGLQPEGATVVEGQQLSTASDEEVDALLRQSAVFARVAPEHKLRLVQRLQASGETVAVTGDGVNDAPALRAAHLGIAMGLGGTDVAREASDIVLADDNFATITAAVEEGRIVFANLRKVTFFLLSTGFGEVLTVLVALAVGWPLPFVAAQILWINLVTNGVQDVALAFEPGEPGLLSRPPRPAREGLITWRLLERLAAIGALLAAGTLFTFWWTLRGTGDLAVARTAAMTQMVTFQFFHVFNCRSLDRSLLRIPLDNRFLFVSCTAAALAHVAAVHWRPLQAVLRTAPLDAATWGLVVVVGSAVIVGGELDKVWNRWRRRHLG